MSSEKKMSLERIVPAEQLSTIGKSNDTRKRRIVIFAIGLLVAGTLIIGIYFIFKFMYKRAPRTQSSSKPFFAATKFSNGAFSNQKVLLSESAPPNIQSNEFSTLNTSLAQPQQTLSTSTSGSSKSTSNTSLENTSSQQTSLTGTTLSNIKPPVSNQTFSQSQQTSSATPSSLSNSASTTALTKSSTPISTNPIPTPVKPIVSNIALPPINPPSKFVDVIYTMALLKSAPPIPNWTPFDFFTPKKSFTNLQLMAGARVAYQEDEIVFFEFQSQIDKEKINFKSFTAASDAHHMAMMDSENQVIFYRLGENYWEKTELARDEKKLYPGLDLSYMKVSKSYSEKKLFSGQYDLSHMKMLISSNGKQLYFVENFDESPLIRGVVSLKYVRQVFSFEVEVVNEIFLQGNEHNDLIIIPSLNDNKFFFCRRGSGIIKEYQDEAKITNEWTITDGKLSGKASLGHYHHTGHLFLVDFKVSTKELLLFKSIDKKVNINTTPNASIKLSEVPSSIMIGTITNQMLYVNVRIGKKFQMITWNHADSSSSPVIFNDCQFVVDTIACEHKGTYYFYSAKQQMLSAKPLVPKGLTDPLMESIEPVKLESINMKKIKEKMNDLQDVIPGFKLQGRLPIKEDWFTNQRSGTEAFSSLCRHIVSIQEADIEKDKKSKTTVKLMFDNKPICTTRQYSNVAMSLDGRVIFAMESRSNTKAMDLWLRHDNGKDAKWIIQPLPPSLESKMEEADFLIHAVKSHFALASNSMIFMRDTMILNLGVENHEFKVINSAQERISLFASPFDDHFYAYLKDTANPPKKPMSLVYVAEHDREGKELKRWTLVFVKEAQNFETLINHPKHGMFIVYRDNSNSYMPYTRVIRFTPDKVQSSTHLIIEKEAASFEFSRAIEAVNIAHIDDQYLYINETATHYGESVYRWNYKAENQKIETFAGNLNTRCHMFDHGRTILCRYASSLDKFIWVKE